MDSNDRTIIYYTANAEDQVFEKRIRDDIKEKAGDIPIISVSRKPIDFGTNICVGERPISYTSEWKQVLIALKAAKTKFCIAAEADCVYPPEYFTFTPPEDNKVYNYNNIWIVWKRHNGFYKKYGYCEGAQMCGREYWINQLEPLLPEDWTPYERIAENQLVTEIFPERGEWTGDPIVSFKTGDGVSRRTTFDNKSKIKELSPFGSIADFKNKYFNN